MGLRRHRAAEACGRAVFADGRVVRWATRVARLARPHRGSTRRLPRRALLAVTMALAAGTAFGSAFVGSYGALLAARLGSALAQALFVAVASQVAMAAVPAERHTAAVARVFAGFALATVIGLPLGSLVAVAGLVLLGGATFVVVPLVQTWLMGRVGADAAGLAASVNISVAGLAGAFGAGLGAGVLSVGLGPAWISPVAAVPVLIATVAALALRRRTTPPPAEVPTQCGRDTPTCSA